MPVAQLERHDALSLAALALTLISGAAQAQAQSAPRPGGDQELAKQLANPVASLISVPLQFNYDCCFNPADDGRYTLNVQPVIPFALSDDLNLIVRTIVPLINTEGTSTGDGFGDTTQSFFFSPRSQGGFTWAAGPVIYLPTGTDGLSARKWGAGPTFLALKQGGGVTYGVLANHLWSVTGADNGRDISATFLQPFLNYTFPDTTGIVVNLESSYDWKAEEWTIPLNVGVSHLFSFGGQRVQLGLTGRAYLDSPPGGPDWGLRFTTTFLFPK